MKTVFKWTLFALLSASLSSSAAPGRGPRDFHVAPDGQGLEFTKENPGSFRDLLSHPVVSLDDARGTRIVFKDGVYEMGELPVQTVMHGRNSWPARARLKASGITLCSASGDPSKCIFDGGGKKGAHGFFVVTPASFSGFTFRGFRTDGAGSALATPQNKLWVSNCVFEANAAKRGGAVYRGNYYDCVFRGNTAEADGGAIFGACDVVGCVFEDNLALAGNGGAVAADYPWASPVCVRCVFRRNAAPQDKRWTTVGQWCVATNACVIESESTKTYGRRDGGPYVNRVRVKPGDDLCAARDRLRKERDPNGRAEIVLAPGTYHVGTNEVVFDRRDDNLIIRAERPGTVFLSGSVDFSAAELKPVAEVSPKVAHRIPASAREKVLAKHLTPQELEAVVPERWKETKGCVGGFGYYRQEPPYRYGMGGGRGQQGFLVQTMLAVDDRLMIPARWPNRGEYAPGKSPVSLETNRCASWSWEGADIIVDWKPCGWDIVKTKLVGWDGAKGCAMTAEGVKCTKKQRVRFFQNVLEELDAPGEWCVDRPAGVLCLYPPEGMGRSSVCSLTSCPNVFLRFRDVTDVHVEGLSFVRKVGAPPLLVEDGERVTVENCDFRALGYQGIAMSGWTNIVSNCTFSEIASAAIDLQGGSARRLQKGNCVAENCLVENCGVLRESGEVVQLKGCGNTIRRCTICHFPHAGINFGGPLMTIEYNRIYDTCYANNDCGALYGWGSMMSLGSVVRFNDVGACSTAGGNHGIYLDDCTSGVSVYGNFIRNVSSRGIMLGGGRNLTISNNVITAVNEGIYCDNRGLFWPGYLKGRDRAHEQWIKAYDYLNPPWSEAFPYVTRWHEDGTNMFAHTDNVFVNNLVIDVNTRGHMGSACNLAEFQGKRGPEGRLHSSGNLYVRLGSNNEKPMPIWRIGGFEQLIGSVTNRIDLGFVDLPPPVDAKTGADWRKGDLRLKPDARLREVMPLFREIPWEKIGYRKEM